MRNYGRYDGYVARHGVFHASYDKLVHRRVYAESGMDIHRFRRRPFASDAPAEVYGHTGFTGTCAWVDPVNELVYVFLSNRIYPDVTNRKLIRLHIRERIQEVIYDAMKKK